MEIQEIINQPFEPIYVGFYRFLSERKGQLVTVDELAHKFGYATDIDPTQKRKTPNTYC